MWFPVQTAITPWWTMRLYFQPYLNSSWLKCHSRDPRQSFIGTIWSKEINKLEQTRISTMNSSTIMKLLRINGSMRRIGRKLLRRFCREIKKLKIRSLLIESSLILLRVNFWRKKLFLTKKILKKRVNVLLRKKRRLTTTKKWNRPKREKPMIHDY